MIQLLDLAKSFLQTAKIPRDGVLADFTMGNGHDTAWLCSLVPEGKVYAFDIQEAAVASTRKRLDDLGLTNARLIHDSHANAINYIDTPIDAGMFNLGYLPGGDKTVTTKRESTLGAVTDAISLLKKGGVLVVSVYPGHEEGRIEGELLTERLSGLDKQFYCVTLLRLINSPDASFILAVEKYDK